MLGLQLLPGMCPSVAWLAVDLPATKETPIEMSDVWIVLIGVSAGWVLSVFTPAATRWLTRRRRRRALALLVCPVLDRFAADCQITIDDGGVWTGATQLFNVPMPTGPEFPAEVDWTSISPRLANRILSLPLATLRADQELGYLEASIPRPERDDALVLRRERCSRLQHDAVHLSSALRKKAKLPPASDDPTDNIWG